MLALTLAALLGAAQDEAVPQFVVDATDGLLPPAALRRLGPGWTLLRDGDTSPLAAADWVSLRQHGKARSAPAGPPVVVLGSGGRLGIKPGPSLRLEDGRLHFTPAEPLRPKTGTELSVYRPYIAVVLLAVPTGVDDVEQLIVKLQREPREHDLVLLRNGDRIEGAVNRLTAADGCEIVADNETIVTPLARLAGIAFATNSLARPRPKQVHALAALRGGGRVPLTSLRLDAEERRWNGRTVTGSEVTFADSALVALDLFHGRALYLTEVPPFGYQYTPYFSAFWPVGIDTTLDGRLIRVGDDYFDKGLSLHGRSRVSYWLDGHFARFDSVVALDPSSGTKGRARLAVIVDGRRYPLADGKELTADDEPVAVRLDVRGARLLTLVVELGSLGDVQARVNWGGARLLRNK